MKKLLVARNIGFCFGVRRTVEMAQNLLSQYGKLYSIGDIVHNPLVMEDLKSKGLKVVKCKEEIEGGNFIVRSHGIEPDVIDYLQKKGVKIFDATCPSVKKIQFLIKKLDKDKFFIIIIGDEKHPEVIGLKKYGKNTLVFGRDKPLSEVKGLEKIAVIGQTTLPFEEYIRKGREVIKASFRGKLVIYNTLCKVTAERQKETEEISKKVDAVLVLGGKNSSNTTKLYKTAKRYNSNVFYIERIEELNRVPVAKFECIGIVSGTSTPEDFISEVKDVVKKSGYREVQENDRET